MSVCRPTWQTKPSSKMASIVGPVVGGPVGVAVQRGALGGGSLTAASLSVASGHHDPTGCVACQETL